MGYSSAVSATAPCRRSRVKLPAAAGRGHFSSVLKAPLRSIKMERTKPTLQRCAIYTRKSSEEGLEQEFNSLHAQREACETFIKSEVGEGWRLLKTPYDDWRSLRRHDGASGAATVVGGYQARTGQRRGGVQGRPLDPLARRFCQNCRDLRRAGRLVRLSDAAVQYDNLDGAAHAQRTTLVCPVRAEVTGERIRDKIAASKRKGMWMGGLVPLGYDVRDRHLMVNEADAATVGGIFRSYQELGSVGLLT